MQSQLQLDSTEVWIAGKGPSLDTYDWGGAGKYRVGINEAAFIVPNCWAAIAVDYPVLNKYKNLSTSILIFQKVTHRSYSFPNPKYLWQSGREVIEMQGGTSCKALQICWYLGFRIFNMVGFDSLRNNGGYAQCIKAINGEGSNRDCFKTINRTLMRIVNSFIVNGGEFRWL